MKKILLFIFIIILIFYNSLFELKDNSIKIYSCLEDKTVFINEDIKLSIYSNLKTSPFTDPNNIVIYQDNKFNHYLINKINVEEIENLYRINYYLDKSNFIENKYIDFSLNIDASNLHTFINLGNYNFVNEKTYNNLNFKVIFNEIDNIKEIEIETLDKLSNININKTDVLVNYMYDKDKYIYSVYLNNTYYLSNCLISLDDNYLLICNNDFNKYFLKEYQVYDNS